MTTHIMVDLETWGTTPGSDIRSIGAVVFDPVAGALGDEFYVNIRDQKSVLTRDPATVEWWLQQSDAAQARFKQSPIMRLDKALFEFADWWQRQQERITNPHGYATFWAHGPHFDEAILAAAYRALPHLNVPWHYRAPRDCRTIFEAAGGVSVPFEGTEHNALDDAKHQARCVIEAYRKLGLSLSPPDWVGDIIEMQMAIHGRSQHRITELLEANNREVERRRAATDLLREAGELFRLYESDHLIKANRFREAGDTKSEDSSLTKAQRNATIAAKIEEFLG